MLYRVAILEYPGAQKSAVFGLHDLFETAQNLAEEMLGGKRTLQSEYYGPGQLPSDGESYAAVILPPSLGERKPEAAYQEFISWVEAQHQVGAVACSVCAGAMLLAGSGILSGRAATTHWALADVFGEQYPEVDLDTSRIVIDDGDIITAGGVMAWVDLGLTLVMRFLGPAVALQTARFFLVDLGGRKQSFYSSFIPDFSHGDTDILRIQRYIQEHFAEKLSLAVLAQHAHLGQRTLLRRFHKATSHKPTEYIQQVRIAKAREFLELSSDTVEQVALKVGYSDVGAFRKVFSKYLQISPGEYRRRFSVLQMN